MIIIKLMGGLGNQMFQYAFGRSLALKTRSPLKLDRTFLLDRGQRENFTFRDYDLNIFNIDENFATPEELKPFQITGTAIRQLGIISQLHVQKKYYIKEQLINFYDDLSRLKGDFYLEGYWQNEKYFKDIEDILKKDFTFKNPADKQIDEIAKSVISTNAVSISIRMGDYLKEKKSDQIYYICDADYYQRAMDKISNLVVQPRFFVFSDDAEWCHKHLPKQYPIQIIGREYAGVKFENYLRLMTLCKYHIIANSTFPWWGAWLNPSKERIIIAPRHWYNPAKLSLNRNSIIPKQWIKI